MKHSEVVAVGERGDEQVDGWEAVMSGTGELRLRAEGTLLGCIVEVVSREGAQLG